MSLNKVLLSPNLKGIKKGDKLILLNRDIKTLLGEEKLSKFKIKIINNGVINTKKEIKNTLYVNLIYEKLLKEITPLLNSIHKERWSLRSWRAFIGPWLNRYIAIVNQRIEDIKPLLKEKNLKFIKRKNYSLVTEKIEDFNKKSMNFKYNEKLYFELYKLLKRNVNVNNSKLNNPSLLLKKKINLKDLKKQILILIMNNINKVVCKNNKFFFHNNYFLKKKDLFKLNLSLNNFPSKYYYTNYVIKNRFNKIFRKKFKIKINVRDKKEKIIRVLLKELMPIVYLEDFQTLKNLSKKSMLPKKKKIIFTSQCIDDDIFKFWVADQLSNGSKLIFAQHGANYGTHISCHGEDHEIKISDKFLTWGWSKKNNKVIPCSFFSKKNTKKIKNIDKKILIIGNATYFYKYYNEVYFQSPYTFHKNRYFNFLENLDDKLKKNIYFKPHPKEKIIDYGMTELIKKEFPNIKILNQSSKIENIMEEYEVLIFFEPLTAFLHALNLNKPCISLMHFDILRNSCKKYYKSLYQNKIIFDKSERAAFHINKNINNLEKWWNSTKTRNSRSNFTQQYIRQDDSYLNKITNILKR